MMRDPSSRSQIAEDYMKVKYGDYHDVFRPGTETTRVYPRVAAALLISNT
jgi:hypothetical protein